MRSLFVVLLATSACVPAIHVPPREAVARTDRQAREVELCVLYQERGVRPRYQGVAEFSFEAWKFAIVSIAVKHPTAGLLIIDPAFGRSVASDLSRAGPIVTAAMGTGQGKTPLVDAMEAAGLSANDVRYAVMTHAHWDHIGALGDLPNARVLISRAELKWATPFTRFLEGGVMLHHLKRAKENLFAFDFNGPPVDGFDGSFDLFGDGSVLAVPLPGHTPGSTGFLVRGKGDTTWLFSGDATWSFRGVELPAHKTLSSFDNDLEVLSGTIGRLKAFTVNRPDVRVIPAHDGASLAQLPECAPGRN